MHTPIIFIAVVFCVSHGWAQEQTSSKVEPQSDKVQSQPLANADASVEDSTKPTHKDQCNENDCRLGIQLAPKVGSTFPISDLGVAFFASFEAGFDFVGLKKHLGGLVVPGLAIEFAYMGPDVKETLNDSAVGEYGYHLYQRIMVLCLEVMATLELGNLKPYMGIGYGFYFLHANMHAFGLTNTEDQTMAGFQTRLGLGYELILGDLFLEIRYHDAGLEFLSTGDANARGITSALGYRLKL